MAHLARSSLKNRSVSEIGVQRGQRDGPVWLDRGKQEIEGRPPSPLAGNANMAADPPHECVHVRQSQTIAFLTLGREKWIKDLPHHLRRDALTAVLDANSNVDPRRGRAGDRGFRHPPLCADPNLAAMRHCVPRVDDEIENRGIEL